MKFKTSAIALAVAGTVATPMAVQADLYASARIGLENVDTGGVSDLRVRSFGSRFGVRGETDLGNGMTGFGRYEWDVDFHDSDSDADPSDGVTPGGSFDDPLSADPTDTVNVDDDNITVRHRYVGLKGDFGSITLGQAYHSYYNLVYGPIDKPNWGAGYAFTSPGRTDQGITYAGSAGAVAYSVTGYFQHEADEDSPDGTEIAVSFPIGDMTLAVGSRDQETFDDAIFGAVLTGIPAGDVALGVGFQTQDDVADQFVIDAGIGNAYVHYESSDNENDTDPNSLTLGYNQSLGRNTMAWYEVISVDEDTGDSDDDLTIVRAVLRYSIE